MARPKRTAVQLRSDLAERIRAAADERVIGYTLLLDKAVELYLERLMPLADVLAEHRTDLSDGRCTNHPSRCMIPGCDHTLVAQHLLDVERFGHDLVTDWCPLTGCHHAQG